MSSMVRPLIATGLFCLASLAHAQSPQMIAGGVYEDRRALALPAHFTPLAGVTVKLYRASETTPALTTKTDAAGHYVFRVPRSNYQVVVDSRSIRPGEAWAEQTYGPAGAQCARPDGSTITNRYHGPCFGGRRVDVSDDASSPATAEHVVNVSLSEQLTNVDFGFSFEAVTSTLDGERVQGSLRQFVRNAEAIRGPNSMRFVPVARAPEQRQVTAGLPLRWWSISLASAVPELRDAGTVVDGTAYNYLSPATIADVHQGRVGEPVTIRADHAQVARQDKPELEIVVTGAEGIVCGAQCVIRSLSIHGAPVGVHLRTDARLEHVMIGAAPDTEPVTGGTVGLQIDGGTTVARHLLVTQQAQAGIVVAAKARLDVEGADVSRCGDPVTGGGIVLFGDGSSIRSSVIAANPGVGIVLGSTDGSSPANGNTIDGSTISGNTAGVILAGSSSRNVITRNDFMWNRLGGITVAPWQDAPPRENRLSANRYDENGLRPIVLDIATTTPNSLARGTGCQRQPTMPNGGISPPRVESVRVSNDRVTVRGNACPGEVVEIYQSYITSDVREKAADLPRIRAEGGTESATAATGGTILPSIGEFNYVGSTGAGPDGVFEAAFPFTRASRRDEKLDRRTHDENVNIWASDIVPGAESNERAFSAIAIDRAGNTSEMSVRRKVD
jgi:parallel beta-helix repeat protein